MGATAEQVVFGGILRAEPSTGCASCKEFKVVLSLSHTTTVDIGHTAVDYLVNIENEDGAYTGKGSFVYHYETSDADEAIEEAVLTSKGLPLRGASVDSSGRVVMVEHIGKTVGCATEVYSVADLELYADFVCHTGSRNAECKVDAEDFFHCMGDLEILTFETVDYESLVVFVENLKIKSRVS